MKPGVRKFSPRSLGICLIYCLTGIAGLVYETVWIRQFALSFGNTILSFSTVISVFLAGLALGAAWAGRFCAGRGLVLYGVAEIWTGLYALAIPWLMGFAPQLLSPLYGPDGSGLRQVAFVRILLCALILLPATIPMGAGLPWLAGALRGEGVPDRSLTWIYAINTAGGAMGAVLTGLVFLPHFGYRNTLVVASTADVAAGLFALWLARSPRAIPLVAAKVALAIPPRSLAMVAVFSGFSAILYELAATRVAGLLFGPTAATVTLTLAVVLLGLAAGAVIASLIRKNAERWLALSQLGVAVLLLAVSLAVAASPVWVADQIGLTSASAGRAEFLEVQLLLLTLFPLTAAAGMALPLAMRLLEKTAPGIAGAIGGLYAMNAAGSIAGSLLTGWLLIPVLGTERTLYVGALINVAIALSLAGGVFRWRAAGAGLGVMTVTVLIFPRWDMAAMTSGAYKYAAYYRSSAASELHNGEVGFLKEGISGTVTVRHVNGSQVLAIDGKVDATDAGGDLLTEKLLAHIPLWLSRNPKNVCVIGLASGVTAGAAITWPVERLDVLEVSREVVQASHLFDGVNGKPLDSSRVRLIVNDGRNHLALTTQRYDVILSEPSNPWIAGMNSMFTREFFQLARRRLAPGGVLAQWFHLYNMPADDLRSLLGSFTEVFPSAVLWQLNEGDVLLTGFVDDRLPPASTAPLTASAVKDLASAGVGEPALLANLYIVRGADLARFAAGAEANTDDRPVLEFHGQRDMQLQTDAGNLQELTAFAQRETVPDEVREVRAHMTSGRLLAIGGMFEKAESFRLAFDAYRRAGADPAALAGMMRTARTPEELAVAGTLETRTAEALEKARVGDTTGAEALLRVLVQAFPDRPEAPFNYGLFCIERSRYDDALVYFNDAIKVDPRFMPAFEAIAETYLRKGDLKNAAAASRRILEIDPAHVVAKQTLQQIEQKTGQRP